MDGSTNVLEPPRTGSTAEGLAAAEAAPEDCEFGAKVARQMGAYISEERNEVEALAAGRSDDARRQRAARYVDYREELAAMDFDQRVEATLACLTRRSSFQNILYGLLGFCRSERTYDEAEEFVRGFPEFKSNRQSARRYVYFLLRTGGIDELELDEAGELVTAERKQDALDAGLDPADLDTLVFDWRLCTTEAGEEALRLHAPARRLADLLDEHPERRSTYLRVLEYCQRPRGMEDIKKRFKGDPGLDPDPDTGIPRVQASSYVSKLEIAGGLTWSEGWTATQEGVALLEGERVDIKATAC